MRNRLIDMVLRAVGVGAWVGTRKGGCGLVEPLEGRTMMSVAGEPLTFDATSPAVYVDSQGNKVTLSMTGPGSGTVYFMDDYDYDYEYDGGYSYEDESGTLDVSEAGLDAQSVEISGSTSKTGFRVDVVPGTAGAAVQTEIGSVHIEGDILSVFSAGVSLLEEFSVSGHAGSITLGDVRGEGAKILLGDLYTDTGSLTASLLTSPVAMPETAITLGFVENLSIEAPGVRITQLTAKSWLDTDSCADVIEAASIDGLTITGAGDLPGDFEGGLLLNGDGVADEDPTLNLVNIAGTIRNSQWDVDGNIERINARQGTDNWELDASGLVAYLTTSRSLIESHIHAQAMGVVSVRQHILDTQITTGDELLSSQFSISSVSVGGTVVDSEIDSQETGVGTVLITGNVQGLSIQASVLTRMNTGLSVYDSMISAGRIGTIFVSLDMMSSYVSATAGLEDGEVSMGNVTVYALARDVSVVSQGSVDNMRFGHLVESYVGVGVVYGEEGWWFTETESGEMAGINTLYLSGTIDYTSYKAMSDSDIRTGYLGSVRVYSVDEEVDENYGIATASVELYQRRLSDGTVLKLTDLENESSEDEIADEAGGYRLVIVSPEREDVRG